MLVPRPMHPMVSGLLLVRQQLSHVLLAIIAQLVLRPSALMAKSVHKVQALLTLQAQVPFKMKPVCSINSHVQLVTLAQLPQPLRLRPLQVLMLSRVLMVVPQLTVTLVTLVLLDLSVHTKTPALMVPGTKTV